MKFWIFFAFVCLLIVSIVIMRNPSTDPTVLIMLGAPGAGKGTQAIHLSDQLKLPRISTGDLFRENLKKNTDLGKQARAYMEKGELVPDPLVLSMLFKRVDQKDCKKGYILDGFPRTIPQAIALDEKLSAAKSQTIVLSLEVPDEEVVDRLTGRLICEVCQAPYHKKAHPPKQDKICDRCGGHLIQRADDSEAVVRDRLQVFHEQTEPLKEYYRVQEKLILIDGSLSKENTMAQIDASLKKIG
ncbi:MAG: adenylate kinase [Chlamydiales bacterium]